MALRINTPRDFAVALLTRLGITPTHDAVRAYVGWQQAEGGFKHLNPLNTTQGAAGASTFNSVGVKTYPDWNTALDATVTTLRNGRYGQILAASKRGDAGAIADAIGASPWGTSSSLIHRVIGTTPSQSVGPVPQQPSPTPVQPPSTPVQAPDSGMQKTALIAQYLGNEHDPNALISLATGLLAQSPASQQAAKPASKNSPKGAPAFDPSAPVGSYTNPHPGNSVIATGRVDEGTDPTIRAGARIVAVGNAKVVNVSHNFYKGLPYIVYKLTDGPRAGQYVYVSEYVTTKVRVGQTLRAGDTVALGTGRAIEEGFAGGPGGGYMPLANRTQGGSYTEGAVTKPGIDWAKFTRRLGSSTGRGY